MNKEMKELLLGMAESLRLLADSMQAVCGALAEEKQEKEQESPAIPLEKVRGVLASKSQAGHSAEVRAIVTKYGASRLSDIDPKDYAAVLKDAEAIGHE